MCRCMINYSFFFFSFSEGQKTNIRSDIADEVSK